MAENTIAKHVISKLTKADSNLYYNMGLIDGLWDSIADSIQAEQKKRSLLAIAEIITRRFSLSLSLSINSIYLTIVELRGPLDNRSSAWRFDYFSCYPLNGMLGLCHNAFIIDKKAALTHGVTYTTTPIAVSNHAIDRLCSRDVAGCVRTDPNMFMTLLKLMFLNILIYMTREEVLPVDTKVPGRIPVAGGYFAYIVDDGKIVITTYIDEGLFYNDQEFMVTLSKESEDMTGKFMVLFEAAKSQKLPIKIGPKTFRVRDVIKFFPSPEGLVMVTAAAHI